MVKPVKNENKIKKKKVWKGVIKKNSVSYSVRIKKAYIRLGSTFSHNKSEKEMEESSSAFF